jgi:hypothetical protein
VVVVVVDMVVAVAADTAVAGAAMAVVADATNARRRIVSAVVFPPDAARCRVRALNHERLGQFLLSPSMTMRLSHAVKLAGGVSSFH